VAINCAVNVKTELCLLKALYGEG